VYFIFSFAAPPPLTRRGKEKLFLELLFSPLSLGERGAGGVRAGGATTLKFRAMAGIGGSMPSRGWTYPCGSSPPPELLVDAPAAGGLLPPLGSKAGPAFGFLGVFGDIEVWLPRRSGILLSTNWASHPQKRSPFRGAASARGGRTRVNVQRRAGTSRTRGKVR
jgi:hypothetical protein